MKAAIIIIPITITHINGISINDENSMIGTGIKL